ncbi:MAG: SDR family NAD(P)-dependent oxidoreductase [Terrimicrobiaceae bacterium]
MSTIQRKPIQDRFKDKVVIVTGGSHGIGKAVVEELCREGAKVMFCALPQDGKETERELLKAKYDVACLLGDLAQESFCEEIVKTTVEKWGAVNCLVNNAFPFIAKHLDSTAADWERVYAAGPTAFSHMTKFVTPHMKKQGGGSIVNMCSVSSHIAQVNRWTYNAAKGAAFQLTQCCALDLAPFGIRVNSVSPAWIRTREISKGFGCGPEKYDSIIGHLHMLNRSGEPVEVAAPILFLLSDDASFITGTDLRIDGGYLSMGPEGLGKNIVWAGSK